MFPSVNMAYEIKTQKRENYRFEPKFLNFRIFKKLSGTKHLGVSLGLLS